MKPLFTLFVLMAATQMVFACGGRITQNNWRWRNNNGSEASATWRADQKASVTYNKNQGTIRLRIEVINKLTRANPLAAGPSCLNLPVTAIDSLQYSTNTADASSWKNIGNDSSKAFVLAGTNVFVNQNDVTTSQITGDNASFSPGRIMVSDSVARGFAIQAPGRTEVEWAIAGTGSMQPNTIYYFRHRGTFTDGRTYTRTYSYLTYPSLTTTAPLPIKLIRFTIKGEGAKAKLEWTTATEQNNDRFEVQRSTDQRIWQMVATVKGRGNSSTPVSYTTYDDQPATGSSYYRLQQFDKDGKSTFSNVVFLRMTGSSSNQFAVFPNPAHDVIRFINTGSVAENITATLSDASGKIIHQQRFGHVQGSTVNTLSIIAPPPGIYLLQLRSSTTAETIKLIIR